MGYSNAAFTIADALAFPLSLLIVFNFLLIKPQVSAASPPPLKAALIPKKRLLSFISFCPAKLVSPIIAEPFGVFV